MPRLGIFALAPIKGVDARDRAAQSGVPLCANAASPITKSANQIVRRSAADESHDCLMTIRVGLPFSSLVIGLAALAHNGTPD